MINIDDEDLDEETLEERVFEKADYIGEVLTGERKIHFRLPKRAQKNKTVPKPVKPSKFTIFITNFKKFLSKYKNMPVTRIIGLIIILIISISVVVTTCYLLLLLLTGLLKLGVIGLVGFSIVMCALSVSGVLLWAARYTRK
jgi:uncharacterized membrane protein